MKTSHSRPIRHLNMNLFKLCSSSPIWCPKKLNTLPFFTTLFTFNSFISTGAHYIAGVCHDWESMSSLAGMSPVALPGTENPGNTSSNSCPYQLKEKLLQHALSWVKSIWKLQVVLKEAVYLLVYESHNICITILVWVQLKVLILIYKVFHGLAPSYLQDYLLQVEFFNHF